jgi:hypothetical protein
LRLDEKGQELKEHGDATIDNEDGAGDCMRVCYLKLEFDLQDDTETAGDSSTRQKMVLLLQTYYLDYELAKS